MANDYPQDSARELDATETKAPEHGLLGGIAQTVSDVLHLDATPTEYIEVGLAIGAGLLYSRLSPSIARTIEDSLRNSSRLDPERALAKLDGKRWRDLEPELTAGRSDEIAPSYRSSSIPAEIAESLKPATPRNYETWLKGFLAQGGEVTHVYDYDMPNNFFMATNNMHVSPLFGAEAVNIIVPKGTKVTGELGHSNLFKMDNFDNAGLWVPAFRDILPGQLRTERAAARAEHRAFLEEMQEHERETTRLDARVNRELMPHLRRAEASDYENWLTAHLENGGKFTHIYDYPMPKNYYVAKTNVEMFPLHGSQAIEVIAPKGIDVSGPLGHSNVFSMDGPNHRGDIVPLYSDILKGQFQEERAADELRSLRFRHQALYSDTMTREELQSIDKTARRLDESGIHISSGGARSEPTLDSTRHHDRSSSSSSDDGSLLPLAAAAAGDPGAALFFSLLD